MATMKINDNGVWVELPLGSGSSAPQVTTLTPASTMTLPTAEVVTTYILHLTNQTAINLTAPASVMSEHIGVEQLLIVDNKNGNAECTITLPSSAITSGMEIVRAPKGVITYLHFIPITLTQFSLEVSSSFYEAPYAGEVVTFDQPGTYTYYVPAKATTVAAFIVGGGARGEDGGENNQNEVGNGGGGGGISVLPQMIVEPGTVITVTVGDRSPTVFTDGGNSSVSFNQTTVIANGGRRGANGGAGGSGTWSNGGNGGNRDSYSYAGGDGTLNPLDPLDTKRYGAGGGIGGVDSDSTDGYGDDGASGGQSGGGAGGDAWDNNTTNGNNASWYGAGGGGGAIAYDTEYEDWDSSYGGNGYNGIVKLYFN